MKMAQMFLVVAVALSLVGCGGTEQDPLASQPENIKNGEPPSKPQPPKETPQSQDVLRIDSDAYHIYRDNTEKEIRITARTEFDDAIYELNVTNLSTFRGATIETIEGDASAGRLAELRFKWTPPKGIAFADIVSLRLKTEVYTKNYEENYKYTRDFEIFIYNENASVPQILNLGKLNSPIREGEMASFQVKVKDVDSTVDSPPSLIISSDIKDINGAPYLVVKSPAQDAQDPTVWMFNVDVDLRGKEITAGRSIAGYNVGVIGSSLRRSSMQTGAFTVMSKVEMPRTTWLTPVSFVIGQNNHFEFSVFDPKGDGILSTEFLTACMTLPGSPRCDCSMKSGVSQKANTLATCKLDWSIPEGTAPQSLQLQYRAENKSAIPFDTQTATNTFLGTINLAL